MDYSDFELLVFRVFNTTDGEALLYDLEKKYIYVPIFQTDGEVPSAIRQGKADMVRFLRQIYEKTNNNE